MFEELLKKNKPWSIRATEAFYTALDDYFDEDKCVYVCEIARELINRGTSLDLDSAEKILVHATQKYFNVDDSQYKADVYYLLGSFYENCRRDYIKAYTAYDKYALNNTKNGGVHGLLMRALMLRDGFTYSDELETELRHSLAEADLGLRSDRLYEALAQYIVAEHNGEAEFCEKLKTRIKSIVKADEIFVLDMIMKKDSIRDVLELPERTVEFIKTLI